MSRGLEAQIMWAQALCVVTNLCYKCQQKSSSEYHIRDWHLENRSTNLSSPGVIEL